MIRLRIGKKTRAESGFVNGLEFPTVADLAVLVIAKGCMPFQAAPTIAKCAFMGSEDKYPKMARIPATCPGCTVAPGTCRALL